MGYQSTRRTEDSPHSLEQNLFTKRGLGLIDFKLHNKALLLRWIWKLYSSQESLWFTLANKLFSPQRGCKSLILWIKNGSFFWKDLRSLFPMFQLSTQIHVRNGLLTSFWFDNWGGRPLFFLSKRFHQPPRARICLKAGLQQVNNLLPSPMLLNTLSILTNAPVMLSPNGFDTAHCRWSSDESFSVAAVYKCWASAGKFASPFEWIWKLKVSPSIKLFLYLMSNDRLLTKQQLQKRGVFTQPGCVLCNTGSEEDNLHLFFSSPFSDHLWSRLTTLYQTPVMTTSYSTRETLLLFFKRSTLSTFQSTLLVSALYIIWMERNNRTFRNSQRTIEDLVRWVMVEATMLLRSC
ncbi:RNA-directed DNA polymerase (reverse transcriptase)-related family protein [Rhynchospora pubera]|uniref:RNA-directed DNA polymerase (Reverse transcriptase)-related family protein n=1 Tax=Rhynchospora pubera TaxID=906938 RepID=A0AAV8GZZ1_9POAL|nr:RNA-directed DNA polymerase (reverse transcriptase)-related family protein [Rhynchospora pubera]